MSLYYQSFPVYPRQKDKKNQSNRFYIYTEFTPIDPEKSTLVLLHGYLGSIEDYSSIIKHFSNYYNIIACDLRGHGASDSPIDSSWAIEDFSHDIYQVICQLLPNDPCVSIIASSLSTAIALQMAINYPEFVERLFLISPTDQFSLPAWAKLLINLGKLTPKILAKGLIEMYGLIGSALSFDEGDKLFIKDSMNRVKRMKIDTHKKILHETIRSWDIDANKIFQPVMILAGEDDNLIPLSDSQELNKKLPNSTLLILRNTDHHILVQRTQMVCEIIDKWLHQNEALTNSQLIYEDNFLHHSSVA